MTCECEETVNTALKSRNARLSVAFSMDGTTSLMVATEQIEKGRGKAKAPFMVPTFCPFCGVKITKES